MYLSEAEARDVISNAQNPHHTGFRQNNAEIVSAVNSAFERSYPGTQEVGGQGPLLERLMGEAQAEQQAERGQGAELPPEVAAAQDKAVAVLQSEWGASYEENQAAVIQQLKETFGGKEDLLADLFVGIGAHTSPELQVKLSKAVLKHAQKRR